jgi:hypothetical protein
MVMLCENSWLTSQIQILDRHREQDSMTSSKQMMGMSWSDKEKP